MSVVTLEGTAAEDVDALRGGVLDLARQLSDEFAKTYAQRDREALFPYAEMARLKGSGMLSAPVPKEYGGLDLSATDTIKTTLILAEGNPAVAQMFLVHALIGTRVIRDLGTEQQKRFVFREIMERSAYIGTGGSEKNSRNAFAYETIFAPVGTGDKVRIKGRKFFCTGSLAANYFMARGLMEGKSFGAIVPRSAKGVVVHDDWKAMGQRGTASGTVDFNDVEVPWEMVLPESNLQQLETTNLFGPIAQSCFTSIYIGIAKAALKHAMRYVRTKTRPLPWPGSGVNTAVEDPYILHESGEMQALVFAAEGMLLRCAALIEEVMAAREYEPEKLTQLRAECSVAVAATKLFATETALKTCQDIFQICGARAGLAEENTDRFWRDARMLTLHDPVDYRARLVGEYLLQGRRPAPSGRA